MPRRRRRARRPPQAPSWCDDRGEAVDPVDLDGLIGAWRSAFQAAERALRAAGRDHDLSPHDLGVLSRRLSDERVTTAQLLGSFGDERHAQAFLARLVASAVETKRLLGLPAEVVACVFNVDGVLVASAAIHADAWKETFDEFIARRIERTGGSFTPFSRRVDYPRLIHGKSREAAVRDFLASRGISLPAGALRGRAWHGDRARPRQSEESRVAPSARATRRQGIHGSPSVPPARAGRRPAMRGGLGEHEHGDAARSGTAHRPRCRLRRRPDDARRGAREKTFARHAPRRMPPSGRGARPHGRVRDYARWDRGRAAQAASASSSSSTRTARARCRATRALTSSCATSARSCSASWSGEQGSHPECAPRPWSGVQHRPSRTSGLTPWASSDTAAAR